MAKRKSTPLQDFLSGAGDRLASAGGKLKDGLSKLSESGLLENPTVLDKLGSTKLGEKLGGAEGLANLVGGGSASGDISEPNANVVSLTPLDLSEVKAWTPAAAPLADPTARQGEADSQLNSLSTMLGDMKSANDARLKGQISGDVADQIRINSAESALAGGIGADSPAARALQAKDFGLTSMDIQERGLATATQITSLQSDLAKISENRYQFTEDLSLRQRAFNEQSSQFGANLAQDNQRLRLAHQELLLRQDMFNAEQNLRLVSLVSQLVTSQAQAQINAASAEIDDSAVTSAFDDMILNIGALLKKSNKGTT